MDIPFSVNEIIQTPMEEFNDLLTRLVRLRLPQTIIMITTTVTNNDEHHGHAKRDKKCSRLWQILAELSLLHVIHSLPEKVHMR